MKIENVNRTDTVSLILQSFVDAASANLEVELEVRTEETPVKGDLIREILFAVGTAALWDLLKYVATRFRDQILDDDVIRVNGKTISVNEIVNDDPEARREFCGDENAD